MAFTSKQGGGWASRKHTGEQDSPQIKIVDAELWVPEDPLYYLLYFWICLKLSRTKSEKKWKTLQTDQNKSTAPCKLLPIKKLPIKGVTYNPFQQLPKLTDPC